MERPMTDEVKDISITGCFNPAYIDDDQPVQVQMPNGDYFVLLFSNPDDVHT